MDRRTLLTAAAAGAAGLLPTKGKPQRRVKNYVVQLSDKVSVMARNTSVRVGAAPSIGGYPNAANTGHTGSLTPSAGFDTTSNGQIIEGLDITGDIAVLHTGVTIRNCRITAIGTYCLSVRNSGCLLEDLTLVGHPTLGLACIGIQDAGQYVMRRCDLSGTTQGLYFDDNCEFYDNYLHDIVYQSGAHCDQMLSTQAPPTGVIIKHNTLKLALTQTTLCWVGDSRVGAYEVLFEDNWLAGGGYSLYAGNGTGLGIRVINNKFSTEYYPDCGYWGPCSDWVASGNTWSGNTWADGPNVGQTVNP